MEHITESSLEHLSTRISYLMAFLDVTTEDAEILRAAKPMIMPLMPYILDAVYTKLLSFDITAKVFVPRNTDEAGEMTLADPHIVMRKDFLRNYLTRLFSASDFSSTSSFWVYLDKVALMHTGQSSFRRREHRPKLKVEYIHMGLLLGYVTNLLIDEVLEMDEGIGMKRNVLKALNKIIWMQNDLFGRHYLACAVGLEHEIETDEGPKGGRQ